MRYRPVIIAVAVSALMGMCGAALANPCAPWTEAMGCQARTPAHPTCAYAAAVGGDIVGVGAWHVSIERGGKRLDYSHATTTAVSYVGAIRPADVVYAQASNGACVTVGQNTGELPC